jgi:catechol 2,3-dioxygenase-like lactoylglutathione lyase family enzyme
MPDDAALANRTAAPTNSPLRVKGLDHVVLRVSDMDRAIGFYETVLGLRVERRLPEIGLVQLRAGSAMIDLVPQKDGEAPDRHIDRHNMDHYAVQIESMDVSALTAHLRRHGVDPGEVRRRYGAEGYGSSIYITDPDGNTVELKGPPEPGQMIAS